VAAKVSTLALPSTSREDNRIISNIFGQKLFILNNLKTTSRHGKFSPNS
jgi:hypothetical protein